MNLEDKLVFFQELLKCSVPLYYWCYDDEYHLLYSDCPKEELFNAVFTEFGCMDAMYEYGCKNSAPMSIGISLGLLWNAIFEKEDGRIRRIHVIGPVFITQVTLCDFEKALESNRTNLSIARKVELLHEVMNIPVVAQMLLTQNVLMLHYCITGEYLTPHDVFSYTDTAVSVRKSERKNERDAYQAWNSERILMRLIREGDLNYAEIFSNTTYLENVLLDDIGDSLRFAKNYGIIFTTICARAAIEGGLSPHKAFSASKSFIRSMEAGKSVPEVSSCIYSMYRFYIESVHQCRIDPEISETIKRCCDYIERNVDARLRVSDVAGQMGYSESHLSRRFSKEMHCSISEYINSVKIERSKLMLAATNESIQQISEQLGFCSRSHFSSIFRKIVGCTPTHYRNRGV